MDKFLNTILASLLMTVGYLTIDTVQAEELADIKHKGSIKMAMSGTYPPFDFFDKQNTESDAV